MLVWDTVKIYVHNAKADWMIDPAGMMLWIEKRSAGALTYTNTLVDNSLLLACT